MLQDIGIDNGITGIEKRLIGQLLERPYRFIGYCHPNTEILRLICGIYLPVSAEKHVVFAVYFIHLRRPIIFQSPRFWSVSRINLSFVLPIRQIVRTVRAKTFFHPTRSVHIIFSVGSRKNKWIAKSNRQWISIPDWP